MAAKKKSDKAVRDAADKLRDMSAEELARQAGWSSGRN